MTDPMEQQRQEILEAALMHVPFDGWSARALERAAADRGIDRGRALVAFPGGGRDLMTYFLRHTDRRMQDALAEHDLSDLGARGAVTLAVRLRLQSLTPHREAVRRLLATLSLPNNALLATQSLYRTVDAIWSSVGDRSADFKYYSKRAVLAGVYTATLFYWLSDESEDFGDTWSFFDRRIDNIMAVQKTRRSLDRLAGRLPSLARAASRLRYPGRSFRI